MGIDGRSRKRRSHPWFRRASQAALGGFRAWQTGCLRVIYYWHVSGSTILFLLAYPKNERDNLTQAQLKFLKAIIETEFP